MLSYGRFYSNDPVGFRDVHSSNHYAYANNNLYKFVDPNGMDAASIKREYNLPSVITMLNSFYFVSQDLELVIPEGLNGCLIFSFHGFSEDGKWGTGLSLNGVYGGEFGTDADFKKATGLFSSLKSIGQSMMTHSFFIRGGLQF
ncbi:hypothetical protein [Pseudoalteromonas sp.]|uniref:hypothetical protein n=1 Tax=Pseudoalteromonas sp. TaxID=53249 RepID=UPI00272D456D|nr:hypothetical protein [Pseudoalteromonas sp.]